MSLHKKEILDKNLFIFDVDGTVKNGDEIVDHFLPFLETIEKKGRYYCFLSNNTSLSKTDHLKNLSNTLKRELITRHLFTPLDQIKNYLSRKSMNKIYVMGTESVQTFFKKHRFKLTDENPEAVVVTFDTSLDYSKLSTASRILMDPSVEFILANKDLRCPTEFGFIPDAGSIANMLKATTEHEVDYTGGKPSTEMFQSILETYGVPPEECVFFGDRLYTDIPMGEAAGILTVLVLTGETKLSDLGPENDMLVLRSYQELLNG
jgi:NagD protein